jgi:biopolymer transport protein ExbD
MLRKSFADDDHGVGGHGDRPWVFFMVDAFLLMVNFFIITFKFKMDEPILAQRMPPGSRPDDRIVHPPPGMVLVVNVQHVNGAAVYQYLSREVTLEQLALTLESVRDRNAKVRVSYKPDVLWQDVMAVFNECQRKGITECGLIPTRL